MSLASKSRRVARTAAQRVAAKVMTPAAIRSRPAASISPPCSGPSDAPAWSVRSADGALPRTTPPSRASTSGRPPPPTVSRAADPFQANRTSPPASGRRTTGWARRRWPAASILMSGAANLNPCAARLIAAIWPASAAVAGPNPRQAARPLDAPASDSSIRWGVAFSAPVNRAWTLVTLRSDAIRSRASASSARRPVTRSPPARVQ